MAKYRIVTDLYNGFEVQIRRWWFPVWVQAGGPNTHGTLEKAEEYATNHANGGCVKYLGKFETT